MKVDWVTVGPFQENAYLVSDETSGKAVLVDPGDEGARIVRMVRAAGVAVEAVWLTHAHLDHIGAVSAIRREWPVPVHLHPDDLRIFRRGANSAALYGLPFEQPADPDRALADGQVVTCGSLSFTVHHTPGHAPGHVVFVGDEIVLGGDLLFAGSIGRTDLPYADGAAMRQSLERIMTLSDELIVLPGHGPATTIGDERATNPFLTGVARPVRR